MGYCCANRCPNTPYAWQLGWLPLQQLDGTSLRPGQARAATLAAQAEAGPGGAAGVASNAAVGGLRIVTQSWANGSDAAVPLYLGYRTRVGGDGQLPPELASRVHIYSSATIGSTDSQPSLWHAGLAGECALL